MLDDMLLDRILTRLPGLTLGVLGDLFLDRYLDIDPALTEPSLETGLDAYQVVCVRSFPGAAGTVINNLAALGLGRIVVISVIGDDGEGYELRQALRALAPVDASQLLLEPTRRTPTYTKPLIQANASPPRELNRLDIKNRQPLPAATEDRVLDALARTWPGLDGLLVLDQVSEEDCGIVTRRVRAWLTDQGMTRPDRFILADSRERTGHFRSVWLKPNQHECRRAVDPDENLDLAECVRMLSDRTGRPVFCTSGEFGILLADPASPGEVAHIPGYPVAGPIDIVGAGDSASAGIACALAAGATLVQAAALGNLIASITIQQIGTTGTASPAQVRERWNNLSQHVPVQPDAVDQGAD